MAAGEPSRGAPSVRSNDKPRQRGRADPRPARLVVGGGALAALSIVLAGLLRPPTTEDAPSARAGPGPDVARTARIERRVRYVRLGPGEKAPPGARVILKAAPTPRVVRDILASDRRTTRPPVARTRQSGG
jgi:hypothetical protein